MFKVLKREFVRWRIKSKKNRWAWLSVAWIFCRDWEEKKLLETQIDQLEQEMKVLKTELLLTQ